MPKILNRFPVMPIITTSSSAMLLASASRLLVMMLVLDPVSIRTFHLTLRRLFDFTSTRYLSTGYARPTVSRPNYFRKSRSPELSSTQVPQICGNPQILTLTRKPIQSWGTLSLVNLTRNPTSHLSLHCRYTLYRNY